MAELAKLDIQIGADVRDATRGLENLNTSLSKFEGNAKKVSRGAEGAQTSLFSLSQVVRDLPFGFIAIQNNLPQVADAFGNLSKQAGGPLKALKALGGALAGPAGISFAAGAAISSITALVQKYGTLGNAFDALFLRSNAAADAQRKINEAQEEGIAKSAAEVVKINSLVSILGNFNVAQEQRVNAYKILKKEYPGIIQNMTQENALTADGTSLISQRAAQLIEYIKLKGKETALTKLIEEATIKQQEEIRKLNSTKTLDRIGAGITAQFQALISGKTVGEALVKPLADANTEVDFFSKELAKLQQQFTKFDPKITGVQDFKLPKVKPVKVPFKLEPKATVEGRTADQIINDQFKITNGIQVPLTINPDLSKAKETFQKTIDGIKGEWEMLSQDLSYTIQNALADAVAEGFAGVGEIVGNIISGQGFTGIKQIFEKIGSTLVQVGKYAIQAGVQMEAFKKAFAVLFKTPAAAIAAGVGLVALGSLLKNKFSSGGVTAFAQGGVVTSPTLAMIGEAGEKEAVIPLSKLEGMMGGGFGGGGRLVTSISGDQLRFVLAQGDKRSERRG